MRVVAAALALSLACTVAHAQAPVQNRGNAAVSGSPSILLSNSQGQSDLCIGIAAAAYGSPILGVTFDFIRTDKNCKRIRQAKLLNDLGKKEAAIQVMCEDADIRLAMKKANTPCELQKAP